MHIPERNIATRKRFLHAYTCLRCGIPSTFNSAVRYVLFQRIPTTEFSLTIPAHRRIPSFNCGHYSRIAATAASAKEYLGEIDSSFQLSCTPLRLPQRTQRPAVCALSKFQEVSRRSPRSLRVIKLCAGLSTQAPHPRRQGHGVCVGVAL